MRQNFKKMDSTLSDINIPPHRRSSSASELSVEESPKVKKQRVITRNVSVFTSGTYDSEQAQANYTTLLEIFDDLIRLLKGNEISEQQRLLRNLQAHDQVFELLKIPYDRVYDIDMKKVMDQAHIFLQRLCFNNPANQKLLHKQQHIFFNSLDERDAQTLTEIYRNNLQLSFEVDESIIRQVVQAIEANRKTVYIEFLKVLITCGAEQELQGSIGDRLSIKKTPRRQISSTKLGKDEKRYFNQKSIHKRDDLQKKVMLCLCDSQITDEILAFFNDKKSYENFKRLNQIANPENNQIDENLRLHVALTELLVACTLGFNVMTEIRCQSLLPIDQITKILTDPEIIPFIRKTYVRFLHHCYIDTENEMKDIFRQNSKHMWMIMDAYCMEVEDILNNQMISDQNSDISSIQRYTLTDEMQDYIGVFMPRTITAFINSQYWDSSIITNDDENHDIFIKTLQTIIDLDKSNLIYGRESPLPEVTIIFMEVCKEANVSLPEGLDSAAAKAQQVRSSVRNRLGNRSFI